MSITIVLDGIRRGALEALQAAPTMVELLSELGGKVDTLQKLAIDLANGQCEYDLGGAEPAQIRAFLVHPALVGFNSCLTAQCKLDKSWAGIHYLLTGKNALSHEPRQRPLEWAVLGDAELEGTGLNPAPRFLTPRQVSQVAEALASVSQLSLLERFDPDEMRRKEIYPARMWTYSDWDYLEEYYKALLTFYAEVSGKGNGVICR